MAERTLQRHLPSPSRLLIALAVGVSLSSVALGVLAGITAPRDAGYARSDGVILGGDFFAFYMGGKLYGDDRGRLYDLAFQREYSDDLLGAEAAVLGGDMPFIYPPVVAAMLAPLARLPFAQAYLIWVLVGLVVSVSSLVWLARVSEADRFVSTPILLIGAFAFFPYGAQTFHGGQASWIGLSILAATSAALLLERDIAAGAIFSLSYYKPPLFVFLLVVLLIARGRRFALGFGLGAAALVIATMLAVGVDGTLGFLESASRYVYGRELLPGWELSTAEGMGIWALAVNLFGFIPAAVTALLAAMMFVGMLCVRLLRTEEETTRLFGLILASTASLAFSAQALKYDLALLIVPMILAVARAGMRAERKPYWLILPFAAFYLEYPFRRIEIGGDEYNLSSALFVVLVVILARRGLKLLHQQEEAS
jgi:hypothetical protein